MADAIRRHGLVRPGDRVVVAVSGGPDSMALLTVLDGLRERLGVSLWVAHLNHRLREAAAEDARFVAAQAASRGLPAEVGEADVRAERRRGESLEAAARRVRYAFLGEVASRVGAGRVAVGHTADDQVETILGGLLRGGELGALAGMPVTRPLAPGADVQVVRPLLACWRMEVLAFLAERGVPWRQDESNRDPRFARNAVRHELLPLLRERLGGDLDQRLLALAAPAGELAGAVHHLAAELVVEDGDVARLDVDRLLAAPRLVRRAALAAACEAVAGPGETRRRALDGAEELLAGTSGREVDMGRGLAVRRSYGELVVSRPSSAPVAEAELGVPGRVALPEVGLWVAAEALDRVPGELCGAGRWEEVADRDRAGDTLTVRTRRPGDRFEPLGAGGSRKLKDFLIDQRVPRHERDRVLVVEGAAGIVWVVGLRLDERAKVTRATQRCVRLTAGKLQEETDG